MPGQIEKPRVATRLLSTLFSKEDFMNDIRRTILWVIFGFSLVMLWDQWQVYNGAKPTFFPSSAARRPRRPKARPPASTVPASAVPAPATTATATPAAVPGAPSAHAGAAPAAAGEQITVTTDLLRA